MPVNIRKVNTDEYLQGYSVLNICSLLDALDLDESVYDVFELDENEKVISVLFHALKKEVVKEVDFLKLKGDSIPNFVSEKIMRLLIDNKISGCDFLEVKLT